MPIEVVPFAAGHVISALSRMYALLSLSVTTPNHRTLLLTFAQNLRAPDETSALRMGGAVKAGPVVTDNGNFVVDATFSPGPHTLALGRTSSARVD